MPPSFAQSAFDGRPLMPSLRPSSRSSHQSIFVGSHEQANPLKHMRLFDMLKMRA
jgi:hypothetical protein